MNPAAFLTIFGALIGVNFGIILVVSAMVLRRATAANQKCAEENRREREDAAREYKALAERVTDAIKQIGTVLHERLPPTTKLHSALTHKMEALT